LLLQCLLFIIFSYIAQLSVFGVVAHHHLLVSLAMCGVMISSYSILQLCYQRSSGCIAACDVQDASVNSSMVLDNAATILASNNKTCTKKKKNKDDASSSSTVNSKGRVDKQIRDIWCMHMELSCTPVPSLSATITLLTKPQPPILATTQWAKKSCLLDQFLMQTCPIVKGESSTSSNDQLLTALSTLTDFVAYLVEHQPPGRGYARNKIEVVICSCSRILHCEWGHHNCFNNFIIIHLKGDCDRQHIWYHDIKHDQYQCNKWKCLGTLKCISKKHWHGKTEWHKCKKSLDKGPFCVLLMALYIAGWHTCWWLCLGPNTVQHGWLICCWYQFTIWWIVGHKGMSKILAIGPMTWNMP